MQATPKEDFKEIDLLKKKCAEPQKNERTLNSEAVILKQTGEGILEYQEKPQTMASDQRKW